MDSYGLLSPFNVVQVENILTLSQDLLWTLMYSYGLLMEFLM